MRGNVNTRHPEAEVAAQDRTLWGIFVSQTTSADAGEAGYKNIKVIAMSLGSNSLHLL